jgi:hypothetical protein
VSFSHNGMRQCVLNLSVLLVVPLFVITRVYTKMLTGWTWPVQEACVSFDVGQFEMSQVDFL